MSELLARKADGLDVCGEAAAAEVQYLYQRGIGEVEAEDEHLQRSALQALQTAS